MGVYSTPLAHLRTTVFFDVCKRGITVSGANPELTAVMCQRLSKLKIGSLIVAIIPDYLDEWLEDLPETAPLALVSPWGPRHWLGPILVPGKTACYRCFATALRENNYITPRQDWPDPLRQRATVLRMAAWLKEWASGKRFREGYLQELDGAMQPGPRHWIRRRAECPKCGARIRRTRVMDSRRLASDITGICSPVSVRRLGPLWTAQSSQQIRHPRGPHAGVVGRRAPVLGRGLSRTDAVSGCMGESIERYCLHRSGTESIVRASYKELAGEGIHPHRLLMFSERQYAERANWNRAGATPFWVPPRFDEGCTVEWIRAESLTGGSGRLVPANYCFYGGRPEFCVSNSNGCAAGRTLDEAILSGLLELIERDAVAIWWYNRINRRRPALAVNEIPGGAKLEAFLHSHNRLLRVFDITPDLGIPTVAAVTALSGGGQILMGAACHLDVSTAIQRAVGEACQMLIGMDDKGRVPLEDFRGGENWLETAVLQGQPHLADSPPKTMSPTWRPVPGANLKSCLDALTRAGLEAYHVDLTRAELGLPVVRVVVPELRFWVPRFAPGRLYEVPVKMGWLREPLLEDQLNSEPWFL
jgi:oxazoline/thiazoline synthase